MLDNQNAKLRLKLQKLSILSITVRLLWEDYNLRLKMCSLMSSLMDSTLLWMPWTMLRRDSTLILKQFFTENRFSRVELWEPNVILNWFLWTRLSAMEILKILRRREFLSVLWEVSLTWSITALNGPERNSSRFLWSQVNFWLNSKQTQKRWKKRFKSRWKRKCESWWKFNNTWVSMSLFLTNLVRRNMLNLQLICTRSFSTEKSLNYFNFSHLIIRIKTERDSGPVQRDLQPFCLSIRRIQVIWISFWLLFIFWTELFP